MSDMLPELFESSNVLEQSNQAFDYSILPTEKREFVIQKTDETQILLKRTAENIIKIGKNLQSVSDAMPQGHFLPWLQSEFSMGQATAYRFMQVASRFKDKFTNLINLPASALYLLASPSTPQEAVDEAIQRAESGEKVTNALAKKIIEVQQAQKRAEEAEAEAQVRARIAQQQLFKAQEEAEEQIAKLTQEIDTLKQLGTLQKDVEEFSTPEPEIVTKEVIPETITQQIEALQKQLESLKQERKQGKEESKLQQERIDHLTSELQSAIRKGVASENDERIRQDWRHITSEARSCLMRLLAQWPSPIDVQSFEADDWARVDQLKQTLRRVMEECDSLRFNGDEMIVDERVSRSPVRVIDSV